MLKIGILGVGGISGAHINGWLNIPEAKITALCDIRPEQMTAPAEKTGAACYTDFDEMLSSEELDIVDICLPTFLHASHAIKALERGINVLVEKPISLCKDDVDLIYETAQKHHAKFMVAHVIRFWDQYTYLRKLYQEQTYGRLLSGSMSRLGSTPKWSWDNWMTDINRSGLVPYDLHIHDLDFLIYTFCAPKNVIRHEGRSEGQDYIHAVYEYDDFFISAEAAWFKGSSPFAAGYRFQFEHALVTYENNILKVYEEDGNVLESSPQTGLENGINLPSSDAYYNEIRYFADCVLNDKPVSILSKEELKTVIDILDSFYA